MFDQHRKLQTEGQCVNVTQSLCRAHLTDPCWRWYCGLAGEWVRGRWFGALPWHFLPRRPTMAPSDPWQKLSSPPWRCWCKSTCPRPPWCGRDQGSAGCWWCPVCALQSDTLHTCRRGDEVSSEPRRLARVLTCLGFLALWLTFYEHERRQRWNSCPGIPRRIYFHPGGCDAPHWQSSGGRCGAIGPLNMRRPPWNRKRGLIGHVGEDWPLKHATQSITLEATSGDFTFKVADVMSYVCQCSWSILQSAQGVFEQ